MTRFHRFLLSNYTMPSDTDVLAKLDLGEPPQHLLEWAKENIKEDPETRCQVLQEFRDMIFEKGWIDTLLCRLSPT
ncbi:hypothetical protein JTB14_034852 [Gonioctena quinquepunctata]|nr:hypothetical protein JTB14_034852 [Gonioctena quinquepunctata]